MKGVKRNLSCPSVTPDFESCQGDFPRCSLKRYAKSGQVRLSAAARQGVTGRRLKGRAPRPRPGFLKAPVRACESRPPGLLFITFYPNLPSSRFTTTLTRGDPFFDHYNTNRTRPDILLQMHTKPDTNDNSTSFFKYQMRVITSHKGINRTVWSVPRCDPERRRGEP